MSVPPRPDASIASDDAQHAARVAFGLSLIWPVAILGLAMRILAPGAGYGFLEQTAPLFVGCSTAIAAIFMARRARAIEPSGLARAARIIGWAEVILSVTIFLAGFVILMEQVSHETL